MEAGRSRNAGLEKEFLETGRNNKLADVACEAQREKTWAECGLEEKVERLRFILQQTKSTAAYASQEANKAMRLASEHQHNNFGAVLQPVYGGGNLAGGLERGPRGFDPLA
jgi:hypothetical protein